VSRTQTNHDIKKKKRRHQRTSFGSGLGGAASPARDTKEIRKKQIQAGREKDEPPDFGSLMKKRMRKLDRKAASPFSRDGQLW